MRQFQTHAEEVDKLIRISVLQKPYILDSFDWIGLIPACPVVLLQLSGHIYQNVLAVNETANILPFDLLLSVF